MFITYVIGGQIFNYSHYFMHRPQPQDAAIASTSALDQIPDISAPRSSPGISIHLLSGASAGLISAITLQPFDLLKTRLQQQQSNNVHIRTNIIKELQKLTQIKDLWRGVIPSTLRTSVGAGLYFAFLSNTRTFIAQRKIDIGNADIISSTSVLPKLSHLENLATGFVVRALVGFITMPITIVKTRFESNIYNYNSMYEGIQGIYLDKSASGSETGLNKGSLRNFFKGSIATLARDCPYAGLYVLFYESFKNDVLPPLFPLILPNYSQDYRSGIINTTAAVLAASVSTTITAPFDAIKTRLQLTNQTSIVKTTKILLAEEGGVKNLFRGLSLRFGRKGLSAGISWCIYEELIKENALSGLFTSSSKLI